MNPLGIIRHYFFATLSFTYSPHHRARKPLVRLGFADFIFSNISKKSEYAGNFWKFLERVLFGLSPCRLPHIPQRRVQSPEVEPQCLLQPPLLYTVDPPTTSGRLTCAPCLKFRYAVFEHVEPPESANRIFVYR